MKCINHSEIDAVNNCGKCGAGLCQECVKNTIFKEDNKPLCKKCNREAAMENANIFQTELGVKLIAIGICSVTFVIGLIFLALGDLFSFRIWNLPPTITMLFFWGVGGFIVSFFRKGEKSSGFLSKFASYRHPNPFINFVFSIVGKILGFFIGGLFMPIFMIAYLIGILKVKKQIANNDAILKRIDAGNN